MARVIFGPLVSSVRGSIAGVVFRCGKGGAQVSGAPSMTRSTTQAKQRAREIISTAARQWSLRTQKEKMSWATYATPSAPPGQNWVPSMTLGRAAFFRWYTATLWCSQSPAYLWPRSPVFDMASLALLYNKRTIPTLVGVVTTNTTAVPTCALWVAARQNNYTIPTRPVWQLVTAPYIGDVQTWQLNPSWYSGGYGLNVSAYLAARVVGWNPAAEWIYRLRICVGSSLVQFVDIGTWDSGVIYP